MARLAAPFSIDRPLSTRLGAVLDYWRSLLRGEATIPFADDVDAARLHTLCPDMLLLGVFERPQRFRLDLAQTPHAPQVQANLLGRFIDEVALSSPLDYLRSQAEATVESAAPTLYMHGGGKDRAYGRLLAPAWGEGHVSLLIGAVEIL